VDKVKVKASSQKPNQAQSASKLSHNESPIFELEKSAEAALDPDLRRITKHLLHTEVRKHNRYCPCCHTFEAGKEFNMQEMGEFLEYIKQLHYKLTGGPKKIKREKAAD
jgi:hypothetical protein